MRSGAKFFREKYTHYTDPSGDRCEALIAGRLARALRAVQMRSSGSPGRRSP